MTMWKPSWRPGKAAVSTASAVADTLTDREGGVAERAQATADNVADALGRLAEVLEGKGLLTANEVQQVFQMYAYEPSDD